MPSKRREDSESLILYSTNTWLAFNIAERYFKKKHYVWCTPFYENKNDTDAYTVAPTSSPKDIYFSLLREVINGDRHSSKIIDNKTGILRGAKAKRDKGIITEEEESEIASVIESAERRDFKPLLYIIPFHKVKNILKKVPVADRAHPLSDEYVIEELPSEYFDIIKWDGII